MVRQQYAFWSDTVNAIYSDFVDGNVPNETNNAMYWALSAANSETAAEAARDRAELAADKSPYISPTTRDWIVWDTAASDWVDTGVDARGLVGPQGPQGEPGRDGVTVQVGPTEISFEIDSNGHLILIYGSDEPPVFYIDSNGHLIHEY